MDVLFEKVKELCKRVGGRVSEGDNYIVCYLDAESDVCIGLKDDNGNKKAKISVTRSEEYGIYSPEEVTIPIDFDLIYELKNAGIVYGHTSPTNMSVTTCRKVSAFGVLVGGRREYIFTWRRV